jgi:hypothetical protein
MNEKPRKCPICSKPHDPLTVYTLDLCYCPYCGVPNFYKADTLTRYAKIHCVYCVSVFDPAQAGGITVTHRVGEGRNWSFTAPLGVLSNQTLYLERAGAKL